jgi:cytochrome bd-type quinol oxidase subunit 2
VTWCTGEVPGSTQVMGITELRAHPGRILVVFGTPIAFAITGFLHLVPETDAPNIYTGLRDSAGLWIAIHVVQLLLILLLAVAVYWLTEGLTSTAARISRVALLPYLVFYSAFDAVVGLSNGLVVNYGSELLPAEQAVLAGASDALADLVHHPVPLTIYLIGTLSWAVAVIAAAVALSQAGLANCSDSIGSGRGHRSCRSCCTFWPSRDAAVHHRHVRAQPNAHGYPRLT